MLPSQTVSLTIPRNWLDLYETIRSPDYFPEWVSGLSQCTLEQEGDHWKAAVPDGTLKIRFTAHNAFGVMDYYVDNGAGKEVFVPVRVVENEEGAEVLITVFRQPLMSEEKFVRDVEQVQHDLRVLHTLLTT